MYYLMNSLFTDNLLKFFVNQYSIVFIVIFIGLLLGRINIKGISLGTAGVFIIALIFGILIENFLIPSKLNEYLISIGSGLTKSGLKSSLKVIENVGLVLFITSIGFTAGPTLIQLFKTKAKDFIITSALIVLTGVLTMLIFVFIDKSVDLALGLGMLMGALSSTPGLTSARDLFEVDSYKYELVESGHAIAYPFGVLGVVLFIQFLPKLLGYNMSIEREKIKLKNNKQNNEEQKNENLENDENLIKNEENIEKNQKSHKYLDKNSKYFKIDNYGLAVFSLAIVIGIFIGLITIPLGEGVGFNLGITGGTLIAGLLFGNLKHCGKLSLEVPKTTLSLFKELGLVFFLTGCAMNSGFAFVENLNFMYFIYGALITILPMLVGYLITRYVFKMELLNRLGAITGGMTSTPALGALIHVSETEDVAAAYASTYPIALFLVVLVPKLIGLFI